MHAMKPIRYHSYHTVSKSLDNCIRGCLAHTQAHRKYFKATGGLLFNCSWERERERKRKEGRERETNRERERERDKQRERETNRERDKQTDRQTDRDRDIQRSYYIIQLLYNNYYLNFNEIRLSQ